MWEVLLTCLWDASEVSSLLNRHLWLIWLSFESQKDMSKKEIGNQN